MVIKLVILAIFLVAARLDSTTPENDCESKLNESDISHVKSVIETHRSRFQLSYDFSRSAKLTEIKTTYNMVTLYTRNGRFGVDRRKFVWYMVPATGSSGLISTGIDVAKDKNRCQVIGIN